MIETTARKPPLSYQWLFLLLAYAALDVSLKKCRIQNSALKSSMLSAVHLEDLKIDTRTL
jgi:hypothetical protein